MPRLVSAFSLILFVAAASAQPVRKVPSTPAAKPAAPKISNFKDLFGWSIGDDYHLATYAQLEAHWKKLATESDRMKLVEIGKSEEGRSQWMAILTSAENHKKLDRYKEIARRLALAEGLTDDQARALAAEGKAVVWIDGGLHATEVLGAAQLMEMVQQMVSRTDPETLRFLNDVIVLCVQANPDGQELVSSGYMQNADPKKRLYVPSRLYQKYTGHDNNRDFYMSTQSETINLNKQLYSEWFPQIMYNHHQSGPTGTILFAPPFRDPYNYNFDPLIPISLNLVGAAMHTRFAAEGKPGATMLEGANYSTWYNGGLRTTTYFHNMIGLLTESNGSPIPMEIPFVFNYQLMNKDTPNPIAPQKEWHFRQSIEYSITANRAIIDLASKHREDLLFNIYQMGRNSIRKGSTDTWTITPSKLAKLQALVAKEQGAQSEAMEGQARRAAPPRAVPEKFWKMLYTPETRDPRGYILPADQPDFLTATKFVQTLMKTGVAAHRATASFTVNGKTYPAGSYVIQAAQAFRPHVIDMFEPQDHPNDLQFPGGPPKPPYDSAGWTLAYLMGIQFDRILDGFTGPFEKLTEMPKPPAGSAPESANGWLLSHRVNDSFIAVNRLIKAGESVYWLRDGATVNGAAAEPGLMYIPAKGSTLAVVRKLAAEYGLNFTAAASAPKGDAHALRPVRIALWDNFAGSMPSGWLRWLLERYEFPFEVVYPGQFDQGQLRTKYDVILFPTGAVGGGGGGGEGFSPTGSANWTRTANKSNVPENMAYRLGAVTGAKNSAELKRFMEQGGTVLAIGSSTSLAQALKLPIMNWVTERGTNRPLSRDKFYVPGSVLQVAVDPKQPLAYGMPERADVYFDASPVFGVEPEGVAKGVKPIAWYDSDTPLRSGWAWGQQYLKGGAAVVEAPVGEGKLVLYGPEITFRAQPHGTFKFLFNGIYYGGAQRHTF
jgi:hypothetical protein